MFVSKVTHFLCWFVFIYLLSLIGNAISFTNCRTPDGKTSLCVSLSNCRKINELKKNYKSDVYQRILSKFRCYSNDNTKVQVCCPQHKISEESLLLMPTKCGKMINSKRILNGKQAYINEYPWMALLGYKSGKRKKLDYRCSGTIINKNYILTAAHCLFGPPVSVRVGEFDLNKKRDCAKTAKQSEKTNCNPPVQDLSIEKIISHPNFTAYDKGNINTPHDIGLIRVSTINMTTNAQPICLPVSKLKKESTEALVAGWGREKKLQKLRLTIMNNNECIEIFKVHEPHVTEAHIICGTSKYGFVCNGDSGSPFMVHEKKNKETVLMQTGIHSFGTVVCVHHYPGAYTDVGYYITWILDNLEP